MSDSTEKLVKFDASLSLLTKPVQMIVLLVDDDNDDTDVFQEVLGLIDKSIIFLSANSGAKALELLASDMIAPDHIFIDINMPQMTGFECLRQIRKRFPKLPSSITIYSTSKNFDSHNEAIKLGASYMTKPDQYQTLIELLTRRFAEINS